MRRVAIATFRLAVPIELAANAQRDVGEMARGRRRVAVFECPVVGRRRVFMHSNQFCKCGRVMALVSPTPGTLVPACRYQGRRWG